MAGRREVQARRRAAVGRARLLAVPVVVLLGAVAGCSSEPSFDRAKAVDALLAREGGAMNRSQAECYVDRVVKEVGAGALDTDPPDPAQLPELTTIRIDCVGLASLGTAPTPTFSGTVDLGPGVTEPQRPGDDPYLDQLHAACGAGNGTACDQLFDLAALGSEYEEFASTCGGRTREIACAAIYPGPSIPPPGGTEPPASPAPTAATTTATTTATTAP